MAHEVPDALGDVDRTLAFHKVSRSV